MLPTALFESRSLSPSLNELSSRRTFGWYNLTEHEFEPTLVQTASTVAGSDFFLMYYLFTSGQEENTLFLGFFHRVKGLCDYGPVFTSCYQFVLWSVCLCYHRLGACCHCTHSLLGLRFVSCFSVLPPKWHLATIKACVAFELHFSCPWSQKKSVDWLHGATNWWRPYWSWY